jgi:hypothetical protein
MANEKAPKGKVWICAACGKRSKDRYGNQKIDQGWDESCILNSVLVSEGEAFQALQWKAAEEKDRLAQEATEKKLCPSCKIDWHETEGMAGKCRACKPTNRGCQEECPCQKARQDYRANRQ